MILSGPRKASPEMAMNISSLFFVNSEADLSLRGRCPRPLDKCASYLGSRAFYRHNDNYYTTEIQPALQGSDSFRGTFQDNSCVVS